MKVAIISGDQPRHKSFVSTICNNFSDIFLILEKKPPPKNNIFFKKENKYFYEDIPSGLNTIFCKTGDTNSENIRKKLTKYQPDIMFVFGCSLLKENIFQIPKKGCVNIHTGIVQLFRGVDSSFWAIHDSKPYGIGATIHYVDKSIDAGNIIYQSRPKLSKKDDFSDLFLKSCKSGFESLNKISTYIADGYVNRTHLKDKGKLYNSRDLTDRAIYKADSIRYSVLDWYLKNKSYLDAKCWLQNNIKVKL